jgi:hypothetical protein
MVRSSASRFIRTHPPAGGRDDGPGGRGPLPRECRLVAAAPPDSMRTFIGEKLRTRIDSHQVRRQIGAGWHDKYGDAVSVIPHNVVFSIHGFA